MIRLRPALWPTLMSLPIFVVALGLGLWQMERREWKRDILDRIAVNQAARPLALDELLREREAALGRLRRGGLETVDLLPEAITAEVLNRYLAIRHGPER